MEIDPQFFAQRVAMLAILAGFLGGCLFVLVYGAIVAICDMLRSRSIRLRRIEGSRSRVKEFYRGFQV